jgi:hypothetical protein
MSAGWVTPPWAMCAAEGPQHYIKHRQTTYLRIDDIDAEYYKEYYKEY